MGWDPLSVEELTELRAPSSKYKVVKDEGWPKKKREKKQHGEGNGSRLQYSCLGNPRDRGARWVAGKVKESESESCSVVSDSLHLHGLQPTRFLCSQDSGRKKKQILSHFTETYIPVGLLRGECKGRSGELH